MDVEDVLNLNPMTNNYYIQQMVTGERLLVLTYNFILLYYICIILLVIYTSIKINLCEKHINI